jgi:hypothetical protein
VRPARRSGTWGDYPLQDHPGGVELLARQLHRRAPSVFIEFRRIIVPAPADCGHPEAEIVEHTEITMIAKQPVVGPVHGGQRRA